MDEVGWWSCQEAFNRKQLNLKLQLTGQVVPHHQIYALQHNSVDLSSQQITMFRRPAGI